MIILNGCTKTVVKTVKINDFCSRYNSLWLEKIDFKNINNTTTMIKYIKYHANNEKEFELCK